MNVRAIFFTLLTLALVYLLVPAFLNVKRTPPKAKAINNAKQIGIAMTEFDSHYGHFPLPHQHEDFIKEYPVQERDDSNYLLGQLLASKVLDSEKVFRIRGIEGDSIFSSPEKILEAGENQFSYISRSGEAPLDYDDSPSGTPIVLGPMIEGTHLFDRDHLGKSHEMVYLKIDSSVATCDIAPDGKAIINEKKNLGLLDTGADTIWGDRPPTIHHPLPYSGAPNLNFLRKQELWKNTKHVFYAVFIVAVIGSFSTPAVRKFKALLAA